MQSVIAGAVFVAVFMALTALFRHLTQSRQAMRERIAKYVELGPPAPAPQAAPGTAFSQKLSGWRLVVRRAGKFFEWSRWSRSVEHKLVQGGLPLKGSEFAAICFGTAMLGMLLVNGLLGGKTAAGGIRQILWGVAGAMLGYLLPQVYLNLKIKRRAKAFSLQLGDALILVANSLKTGYSFLQAVDLVSREMKPPISAEFARMLKEMNLGVTTEDAMNNLAKRVDSDDLDLVVTAVLIQRQVGGNLAEVLENIAATIRERVKLKREIRTLTAQGRVSGIIVGLLPFVLAAAIYFINPGYMEILFAHPLGQMMLGASAAGMIVGVIWVKKIVDIKL